MWEEVESEDDDEADADAAETGASPAGLSMCMKRSEFALRVSECTTSLNTFMD